MLKIRRFWPHDFVLYICGDYEEDTIKRVELGIADNFGVGTTLTREPSAEEGYPDDYVLTVRTDYHTFYAIRYYMKALWSSLDADTLYLVKHDEDATYYEI